MPALFETLRVLVDRPGPGARYVILGSASPSLVRGVSESLAGRIEFLEPDVPQLGFTIPAPAMRRFWTMLAQSHGRIWNASKLAPSMGLSDKTVRSYLDILTGTFLVRQLQPWHTNIGKRQVKAPKICLRDS